MSTEYLVADDSLFARMLVKNAVKEIDDSAIFTEAQSGAQVLKVNGENKDIEWYLLDINMEEPNGIETAGELINAGVKNSKIALITGNRSVDFQDKAKEMGVCYINKAIGPQDVDAFVDRLRKFFSGSNE